MNYSQVLAAFQAQIKDTEGNRYIATRKGWNGANQFIGFCTQWNGNLLVDSPDFEILPFTYIKSAQNKLVPWVPSQTDQMAEDWEISIVPATGHDALPEGDTVATDETPSANDGEPQPDPRSINQPSLGEDDE